jgi:hypothetical protein
MPAMTPVLRLLEEEVPLFPDPPWLAPRRLLVTVLAYMVSSGPLVPTHENQRRVGSPDWT